MHMMFVDESGDPGYPPTGKWQQWGGTRTYVRVGVIIHGWKWKAWNDRFLQFKHSQGLTRDAEIKASDIRRGDRAFVGWDENRRRQFLLDLATLIGQNIDIALLGIVINKTLIDVSKPERMVRPEVRSLELILERYNLFLRHQQDKSGVVILDPVKESSDDNLRRFQSFLSAQSSHLKPLQAASHRRKHVLCEVAYLESRPDCRCLRKCFVQEEDPKRGRCRVRATASEILAYEQSYCGIRNQGVAG